MGHSPVDAYVAAAPAESRPDIEEIRALIRAALPLAQESMSPNGFVVYADDAGDWLAGFAHRKKGAMLYVMKSGVLDRFAERLGRLRSGRSCVDWKASRTMSLDDLRGVAREMLAEVARDS